MGTYRGQKDMQQVPSIYHHQVGEITVTAICDGYLDTNYEIFHGITPEEGDAHMRSAYLQSPPRISVNSYLVRSKGRIALIEAGAGHTMGATLGFLPAHLAAAGVNINDIETVLLTHMHPDHSNGLTDADGSRVFPASEIALADAEMRHWQDDSAMAAAPERKRERYFRAAREQLRAYGDQLRPFTGTGEVFPGITPVPSAGHTPGHTAYLVADGDDSLLIWGDTVHVPHIQIRFPHVTLDFDSDEAAAAAMRRRLLEIAVTEETLVGGMHLDFPGFGHIGREDDGYRFFAAPWNPIL